jgi:hypothetical protein
MATLVLIVLLAWLVTAVAVLGLARLLGRLSAPRPQAAAAAADHDAPAPRPDNVVALVPRPRNDLVRARRAA